MTVRSVVTKFTADVNGYISGVSRASSATRSFANQAEKSSQSAKKQKDAWDKAGRGMLLAGGVIAAGVGVAVKSYMDFDKQMSAVQAALNGTPQQIARVTAAVREAGKQSVFTSVEAGQAAEELAKAGLSTSDIVGGALTGSMDLAAAGAIGLGDAAELSAQAMKIFGLQGKDVTHVADVLTAGANKSAAGVGDLGQALEQGGLLAKQTGLTLEGTVGTLSAFADNALKGSDAGTSLKTMLQRLTPQSKEAAEKMQELGFSAYDAKGNFIGMPALAGEMKDSFGDLTPKARNAALAVIFGSDAVRGSNVLMKLGEDGIRKYIDAVDDQGIAARTASTRLDNLSGDVEKFTGALSDMFIEQGSAGNDFFRNIVQKATGAVDAFSRLPTPVQHATFYIAAAGSATLLFAGAAVKAVRAAQDMAETMQDLGIKSLTADTRVGGLARSVGAVGIALGGLAIAGNAAQQMYGRNASGAREAARSLEIYLEKGRDAAGVTGAMSDSFSDLGTYVRYAFQKGAWGQTKEFFSELGTGFGLFGPTGVDTAQNFFKEVDAGLAQMLQDGKRAQAAKIFGQIADQAKRQGISVAELKDRLPAYAAALDAATVSGKQAAKVHADLAGKTQQVSHETDLSIPKMDAFGNKLVDEHDKAVDARTAIQNLANSIRGLGNTSLAASDAEIGFQQAIDDATKAIKENGRNTDINTQKGRQNRQALNQIATSSHNLTGALVENNASQKKVTQSMEDGRRAFIKAAESMGYSRREAKKLADQAGFTKADVDKVTESLQRVGKQHPKPKVDVLTAQAQKNVKEMQAAINGVHGKTVHVNAQFDAMLKDVQWVRGTPTLRLSADGSTVPKDGGAYGDRYPYLLAPGEEVISNRHGQADRNRALLKKINAGHDVGHLADGGTAMPIRPGSIGPDVRNAYETMIVAAIQAQKPLVAAAIKQMLMSGGGPHVGGSYRGIEAMVEAAVPSAIVTSDFRPGARTTFGNLSRHAMGKAVDFAAPNEALWEWLRPRIGRFYEVLGPHGMWLRGHPYFNPSVQAMHENHYHVSAYADGTRNAARGWALVGEEGPELVRFRGGEQVMPNYASQRIMQQPVTVSGGTPAVHVTAVVENPWTGEQVTAHVRDVAVTVSNQQISRQNRREAGAVS